MVAMTKVRLIVAIAPPTKVGMEMVANLAPQPQQQQQQQQQQQHRYPPPPMSNQSDYSGGPNRDYRESGGYPPPQHDFRSGLPPPNGSDGRLGPTPGITLGSGPLNNQSQYNGPVRYDGGQSGTQSPASSIHSHNPYGSAPGYSAENAPHPSRGLPSPMRPPSHYETHLPPKPDNG
jgi:hypothetical protein